MVGHPWVGLELDPESPVEGHRCLQIGHHDVDDAHVGLHLPLRPRMVCCHQTDDREPAGYDTAPKNLRAHAHEPGRGRSDLRPIRGTRSVVRRIDRPLGFSRDSGQKDISEFIVKILKPLTAVARENTLFAGSAAVRNIQVGIAAISRLEPRNGCSVRRFGRTTPAVDLRFLEEETCASSRLPPASGAEN